MFLSKDLREVEDYMYCFIESRIPYPNENIPTLAERDGIINAINHESKNICEERGINPRLEYIFSMFLVENKLNINCRWYIK